MVSLLDDSLLEAMIGLSGLLSANLSSSCTIFSSITLTVLSLTVCKSPLEAFRASRLFNCLACRIHFFLGLYLLLDLLVVPAFFVVKHGRHLVKERFGVHITGLSLLFKLLVKQESHVL